MSDTTNASPPAPVSGALPATPPLRVTRIDLREIGLELREPFRISSGVVHDHSHTSVYGNSGRYIQSRPHVVHRHQHGVRFAPMPPTTHQHRHTTVYGR